MLRDRYEADPRFEEILKEVPLKIESELIKIDCILSADELFKLIKQDLAKRRPKTLLTGRNATPVEVIVRLLAVRRMYGWSYAMTQERLSDRLVLRWFCRVYLQVVPDGTNINRKSCSRMKA